MLIWEIQNLRGCPYGYEDERKIYGTAEEMTDIETNSLTAVFLEREKDER